jgi:DNA-directed RNA polymerase subunit RPC12/RpoP
MKIRYYGFLGAGSSLVLDDIRAAIARTLEFFPLPRPEPKEKPPAVCPHCGGRMVFWYRLDTVADIRPPKAGVGKGTGRTDNRQNHSGGS